jgi:hypothetical protein
MSRAQLTSTVEQNSAGAASPFVAGKNKIINGDFSVWQRGTTFNGLANQAYFADRWCGVYVNGTLNVTNPAFTPGSAPVAGYEGASYLQIARTSTSGTADYFGQRIEDVRTLAGQTVTVSFWAKSTVAFTLSAYFDQNFGSGGSATNGAAGGIPTVSVGTSWQRYSVTIPLSSVAGKTIGTGSFVVLNFQIPTAPGNLTFSLWGVQLEAGSVATPFTTASGTLQGELALCQRYFRRFGGTGQTRIGVGWAGSGSSAWFIVPVSTPMRVSPTVSISTLSNLLWYDGSSGATFTAFAAAVIAPTAVELVGSGSSGLTTGRAVGLTFDNAATYMDWSAEL